MDLKQHIRHVPDFPKPGILFYDITTPLLIPDGLRLALDRHGRALPWTAHVDLVVGMESRGFIFGAALADRLKAGFVPAPQAREAASGERALVSYDTRVRVRRARDRHADAITPGQRVLIVDYFLATGGTAAAAAAPGAAARAASCTGWRS